MLFNTLYILIFLLLLPFFLLKSCISKNFRKIFFYRLKASFFITTNFFSQALRSKKFDLDARSLGGRGRFNSSSARKMANSLFYYYKHTQWIAQLKSKGAIKEWGLNFLAWANPLSVFVVIK